MSSVIKSAKFGVAGALMLACALVAACGSSQQLDYPENWPAEFAQQVHNEFDGFYNGVAFTAPLPATDETLAGLKEAYNEFVCCFPNNGGGHDTITEIAHVLNQHGEVVEINAPDSNKKQAIDELFLYGGVYLTPGSDSEVVSYGDEFISSRDDTNLSDMEEVIPFDEIMWIERVQGNYVNILTRHYKLGDESVLCDILDREGRVVTIPTLPYSCSNPP